MSLGPALLALCAAGGAAAALPPFPPPARPPAPPVELARRLDTGDPCLGELPPSTVCTACQDVILLVDSSGSHSEFVDMTKAFLEAFVSRYDLVQSQLWDSTTNCGPRVGIIAFDEEVNIVSPLTTDVTQLDDGIENFPRCGDTYPPEYRSNCLTGIANGLNETSSYFLANARPSAMKLIVLITDGEQTTGGLGTDVITAQNIKDDTDIKILSLGVGPPSGTADGTVPPLVSAEGTINCDLCAPRRLEHTQHSASRYPVSGSTLVTAARPFSSAVISRARALPATTAGPTERTL
jgi:hypothetical protein